MTKNYVCHASYLRNHASYDTHVENYNIYRLLFRFFKIFIFWVVRGAKRQKTVKNDKYLCSSCFISQKLYMIWLSFMIHMCQMIVSLGIFFQFFKIFIFQVVKGGKRTKNGQKWPEMWLSFMVRICKMIISLVVLFVFPKFQFYCPEDKKFYLVHSISHEPYTMW